MFWQEPIASILSHVCSYQKPKTITTMSRFYPYLKVKTIVLGNSLTQDSGKVIILSWKCYGFKKSTISPMWHCLINLIAWNHYDVGYTKQCFGQRLQVSALSQVYSHLKVKTIVLGNGLNQYQGKVTILSQKSYGFKKNTLFPKWNS